MVTSIKKKGALENKINNFIDNVLNIAQTQGKLDYIDIEISNHNGTLQMNYKLRDRKKAY
ncbi:hypothetical protein [Abyssisolibacter fermentans]|uniref:hypothetical protein n=1 Tax=Abyssisolibacter fermentans TaxID=1766203 RepID=UPI00082C7BBA|nr:hypothetical protein [Abyssisolibacter fermentans]